MRAIALGILLAGLSRAAYAGPEVELSVTTTTADLARPVIITAKAAQAGASKLELDLQRSTTDSFAISKVEPAGNSVRLTILPLAIGKLPIPLFWNLTESGKTISAASNVLALDVSGPAVGPTTQIQDIRSPAGARRRLWPWLILLLALAGAAYWFYREVEQTQAQRPAEPVDDRPADARALEALDQLRASTLWKQQRYKEFYAALTEIARLYLEERFQIPATHLTTLELSKHLKQTELERSLLLKIKDIFDRADLVKFAKISPEEDWGPNDLDGIAGIVQQTAPPVPTKVPEAAT